MVLKRVVELYRAQGLGTRCGPEMEFFLVAATVDPAKRSPMMGRSGRPPPLRVPAYSHDRRGRIRPVIANI